MSKRKTTLLGGLLFSALALGAGEQPFTVTADSMQIGRDPTTTELNGHVLITISQDAQINVTALHVSVDQNTGDTFLEGDARVTMLGAEVTADHLAVKRRLDGVLEVTSDRMRIVRVASL